MKHYIYLLLLISVFSCKKENKLSRDFADGFFKQMPSAGLMSAMIYDPSSDAIYIGGSAGESDKGGGSLNLADWQGTGRGREDGILMKYNLDGKLAWAKQIGGTSGDIIKGVAVDNAQNVYVTGIFGGTVNFDGTELKAQTSYVNDQTAFITKYNKDGNQLWVRKVTNAGIMSVGGIVVDNTNNRLYIAGDFDKKVNIGDAMYTKEGGGFFIASYTLDGTLSWAKIYGDKEGRTSVNKCKLFKDGSILLTGSVAGNQAIEGYEIGTGGSSVFFARFDGVGNTVWAKKFENHSSYLTGLAMDENDNFYVSSSFNGMLNIGGKSLVSTGSNFVLVKYNQAGDFVWVAPLLSPGFTNIQDVYYRDKKIYTAGYYTQKADFGDLTIPAADNNAQGYSARYNSENGKCESAANFESTKSYAGQILAINSYSFICGQFESTYIFQGVKFKAVQSDGFFMKFKTP